MVLVFEESGLPSEHRASRRMPEAVQIAGEVAPPQVTVMHYVL